MDSGPPSVSGLRRALQRYVDARSAAIIEARRALKVNEVDARALLYIAAHPGTRPGHLRDYLGLTSAGVTTLVDRLAGRGVVSRTIDPDDRRVNRLSLLIDLGVEPWSGLTRFDDHFDEVVGAADPDEVSRLADALDGFTSGVLAR